MPASFSFEEFNLIHLVDHLFEAGNVNLGLLEVVSEGLFKLEVAGVFDHTWQPIYDLTFREQKIAELEDIQGLNISHRISLDEAPDMYKVWRDVW